MLINIANESVLDFQEKKALKYTRVYSSRGIYTASFRICARDGRENETINSIPES